MDDPRFQQFFCEPHSTQQRRYEAIRAVVVEGQPPQAVAARFGFAYGTLRNLVAQFHADIRQGQTPPFSPASRADAPRPARPTATNPRPPTAGCSPCNNPDASARVWPDSSCSFPCSRGSVSTASSTKRATPARA